MSASDPKRTFGKITTNTTVMTGFSRAFRACFVLTWILFVVLVLLSPAAWSSPIHRMTSLIGVVAAPLMVLFAVRERRWKVIACFLVSVAFVLTHIVDLAMRVHDYMAADLEFGVLRATWLKLVTSVAAPMKLIEQGSVFAGATELYLLVLMPLLQLLAIFAFVRFRLQSPMLSSASS